MSVQFGKWNFDGRPIDPACLRKVEDIMAPYGPDGITTLIIENVALAYGAFHTTAESRREYQPLKMPSGSILMWDGRLDNRAELLEVLKDAVDTKSTDIDIVAAAFTRWENDCFARLTGDWAVSIWNSVNNTLILAKDIIGIRHLYYTKTGNNILWSTLLDPFILLRQDALRLEEEYIAGWLSFLPAAHLTPYEGIHAVPPASFVVIHSGNTRITKYWDFDPDKRIRYRSDPEYEEHFRSIFGKAIQHRLRADAPIVAELSGGMDSSSIVCMADRIVASGSAVQRRIETMSIYNDSESTWDERPYFTKVEAQRGRTGYHVDSSKAEPFRFDTDIGTFAAAPGASSSTDSARAFAAWIKQQGIRVVLSGIGGDEVCGGVPTPIPELADLLVTAQWRWLLHQLRSWALDKRVPWSHLLSVTLKGFLPLSMRDVQDYAKPLPWLSPGFVERNKIALQGYPRRSKFIGPLPSFQTNLHTLETLWRYVACISLDKESLTEYRYPYLDRDLLEFSFAIPRAQWVRPGQRRSLMRRALAGIVPSEVLGRKRKAYVGRSILMQLSRNWPQLMDVTTDMVSQTLAFVDAGKFIQALEDAVVGKDIHVVGMTRTLGLEHWLRTSVHTAPQIVEGVKPRHQSARDIDTPNESLVMTAR
jgi:asparagine synthase (glutamine-hydrolysing)